MRLHIKYKGKTVTLYLKLVQENPGTWLPYDYLIIEGGEVENKYLDYDSLSRFLTMKGNYIYNKIWSKLFDIFLKKEQYIPPDKNEHTLILEDL